MSKQLPPIDVCGSDCPFYSDDDNLEDPICEQTMRRIHINYRKISFPNFCPLPDALPPMAEPNVSRVNVVDLIGGEPQFSVSVDKLKYISIELSAMNFKGSPPAHAFGWLYEMLMGIGVMVVFPEVGMYASSDVPASTIASRIIGV